MSGIRCSRPARILAPALAALVAVALLTGCSGAASAGAHPTASASGPRALTSAEAQRLAVVRFNLYQAKVSSVDATIVTGSDSVAFRGWVDADTQDGYALVTPDGDAPDAFLTSWTATTVSAEPFSGTTPPLPAPTTGWQSTELKAGDSALAAAQLLVIGLSSDRPDNPQLLLQGNAQWVRSDTIGGVKVDVMSGPVDAGTTTSNLRYWIDAKGHLLRLEARLDGVHWSTFDFASAPGVTF